MKNIETLTYLDNKYQTEFISKFNELGYIDFLKYVERQVIKDFQNFYKFMVLFDFGLDPSNQNQIDEDLLKTVVNQETLRKVVEIYSFVLNQFKELSGDLSDDTVRLIEDKLQHYSVVLSDYYDYLGDNSIELQEYIDYRISNKLSDNLGSSIE